MCKYCEGRAPLITTGCLSGHNIDVGIWEDKLIAESRIEDAYGNETVNKGKEGSFLGNEIPYFDEEHDLKGFCEASLKIDYCPFCGRSLKGDTDNG